MLSPDGDELLDLLVVLGGGRAGQIQNQVGNIARVIRHWLGELLKLGDFVVGETLSAVETMIGYGAGKMLAR